MTNMSRSTPLSSRQQTVLDVLAVGVELTDAEIVASIPALHRGQVIPVRVKLERLGLVELIGKNAVGHKVWCRTPDDRVEAARAAAALRQKTPAQKLARRSVEARVQVVAALLEDEAVNRALRDQTERVRGWRHARARASEAHLETEAERRERKRRLRQAERAKTIYLDFLKVHDGLRDAISVLLGIRSFMQDELGRRDRNESTRIPLGRWPDVGLNVRELVEVSGGLWHDLAVALGEHPEHCPLCGERTARDPHALEEAYIDVDVVEESDDDDLVSDGRAPSPAQQ